MDVFIEIKSVSFRGPDYTKLKIYWWNKGQVGRPWPMLSRPSKIKILKEHYAGWSEFSP